jgi:hypothetical protein
LATALPSAWARPSIVRLPSGRDGAVEWPGELLVLTVEVALASPMETKPPPPLVDSPDTRPMASVVMLTFRPGRSRPHSR